MTMARRVGRIMLKFVLGVLGLGALLLVVTPTGRYLVRAGYAEAKILVRREPIARLVNDTTLDAATRGKLQVVQEARRFAVDSLGLTADASFTTYSRVDSDTLVLVLSAAYRDSLALRTKWWPVVGRVPYQGYFDFAAARAAQAKDEAAGFDTDLRPASAFSTLGWFNDPLLNTTLRADSTQLVNTVIHELVHSTVWIAGDAVFNESFANFVGTYGALAFFRAKGDTAAMTRIRRDWQSELVLGAFYAETFAALTAAFDSLPGAARHEARLAARERVFAAGRARLAADVAPALGITDTLWAQRLRLNNATVMSRRVYRTGLAVFDSVLVAEGGDLRVAFRRISAAAKQAPRGEGLEGVRALLH
jgi:predicted aminopeptidase